MFDVIPGVDYYCVIGNPVVQSKSPAIHQAFAAQTGQRMSYEKVLVPLAGFSDALVEFKRRGGRGLNVTVPFKQQAFAAAETLSARARMAGAVNTMWLDAAGGWHADNTDGAGLLRDLQNNHRVSIHGRRILVCGAGGAARGALPVLLEAGPQEIVIANRTLARAQAIVDECDEGMRVHAVGYDALCDFAAFDLIINATSSGLSGAVPPVPAVCVAPHTCCYDMMYGDGPTAFQRWSQARGAAVAIDGLGMLVEQAAEAFRLWRGVTPDSGAVIAAMRNKKSGD
ncbi:MAG: shikimate dehydrogenase [Gammaproteobacteria bacterium]|nr:shikimate dehydrogenase [Gammaproteobacteria bacterium]